LKAVSKKRLSESLGLGLETFFPFSFLIQLIPMTIFSGKYAFCAFRPYYESLAVSEKEHGLGKLRQKIPEDRAFVVN
jgi:hypothetical protein